MTPPSGHGCPGAADGLTALLLDRRDTAAGPRSRRVALAIEGGGMRGVVAGGMVSALDDLGLLTAFDVVYGASAGAIVGAYFVAGQARYGTRIFSEDINNRQFIDPRRMWRGEPAVSVDFLLDEVCNHGKRLAADRVLSAPVPLRVTASSVDRHRTVVLGDFPDRSALIEVLRCSARIPFFAGPPVEYGGERLLDALLYEPIPFGTAAAEGATDIVVLLTRPGGMPAAPRWAMDRLLIGRYLRRLNPKLAADFRTWPVRYAATLERIAAAASSGQPVRCLPIRPAPGEAAVGSMETDRAKLVAGAAAGHAAVMAAFGHPALRPAGA